MSYEVYGPYLPVIMLITFIALFAWVLHPKNKKKFDDAANLPFEDEEKATGDKADNGRKEK
ncbi:cbb3-type cytochrome oxidase subunit 3 [Marinobacterium aestuariivivens]|uniref:Cbb3-type cytochrome oxidase subunit 3 n=1 Tax=Marinobacterium aestuariivivens TaxID=1698799 RepID=A0ABW2A834_9GAMM